MRRPEGFSLVELLITLALLSLALLSAVGTFRGVAKGIFVTKAKSLATNLAQEKVEFLKAKSYYRLRVTTAPVAVTDPDPDVMSDPGNYAPEAINGGGIAFTRHVYVEKVRKNAASAVLEAVPWNDPDTGLKRITVALVWQEGAEWRQLSLVNLRENPDRASADVVFKGEVTSGGFPVAGATVEVAENPAWRAATNSAGRYEFNLSPGTYTLRANAPGYFRNVKAGCFVGVANTPATENFILTAKLQGAMHGSIWKRDHLVISQVGAQVNAADPADEFVELYNPTTFTISAVGLRLIFVDATGVETELNPLLDTTNVSVNVPPQKFFLFGNKSPVGGIGGVAADAYRTLTHPDIIKQGVGGQGGIVLFDTVAGSTVDMVAWGHLDGIREPPLKVQEGGSFYDVGGLGGLNIGETLERMAYSSSTLANMEGGASAGIHNTQGNSFDNNVTSNCWVYHNHADLPTTYLQSQAALSVAESNPGETGTPAAGAYVFADDGLSTTVTVTSTGGFTLASVATGTWVLSASSGTLYAEKTVTVAAGSNSKHVLALNTMTNSGYVSGEVTEAGGAALANIIVNPAGVQTDASGRYRMSASPGLQTITANPGSANAAYIEGTATVTVNTGQIVSNVNFGLFRGGRLRGMVTSDGVNALPDIPVSIRRSGTGLEVANILSQINGTFEVRVPSGTYTASPIPEFGEVVTPSVSPAVTVAGSANSVFTSTFTLGPALGTVAGSVSRSGEPITTGVLIVASSSPISGALPPAVDSILRSGAIIYYMDNSGNDGRYAVDIHAGTYNVYAWYTTYNGAVPTTTKKEITGVVVSPGQTAANKNFSWP
jgi:prepilin-type N-terminal cleavage/methylation domain-containing protein